MKGKKERRGKTGKYGGKKEMVEGGRKWWRGKENSSYLGQWNTESKRELKEK